jgi:exodeoxyribonuclease VII small subunit
MNTSPAEPASFEEALAELETILHQLEDGATGLEDALGRYERGVALLKRCYGQLRGAEQRILLLTGVDEDGRATTQPFEHTASVEGDGKRRRS